jgi:beta-glucuronidase
VSVPDSYNAGDLSKASMTGWVGWYRRDFTVPRGGFASYVPRGSRRWIVRFESVNYRATVWLNGKRIGSHTGAFLPFEFDLGGLRKGVNRLVVRVDNRRSPTDLPPGPSGLWWNYGGINREVYLRAVQRADLAQVRVRPMLRCPSCAARIAARVVVRNVTGVSQRVRLRGSYGRLGLSFGTTTIGPHGSWSASASVRVAHPRLWSVGKPALYRARLLLQDARGRRLAGYVTDSGIRKVKVIRGHLTLNGRLLNLRGVGLHEQALGQGEALDPAHLRRLFGWAKAVGATVIRTHYPLNPQILELADRNGILIWSEVPVYQVQNKDLANAALIRHAHAILRENIETNQNHPSVLLWSIGNELQARAAGYTASYIAGAANLAHRLDPTRPVGLAIKDWTGVGCRPGYAPLDVLGVNEYYGWFDAGAGVTNDRDRLSSFLDEYRACYPNKGLFVTEFGFDGNRHGPVEERGTYEFQSNSIAYHLGVFARKPWLSGAIYWTLQDWAAAPGWSGGNPLGRPPFVEKGLVDIYGNDKPGFPLVSAIYHATRQVRGRAR